MVRYTDLDLDISFNIFFRNFNKKEGLSPLFLYNNNMKSIKFLVCLLLISSCGGGGGGGGPSVPFALTLAQSFFSTDEDSIYTGSVAASANEPVTLEYSLTNSTSNGTLTFSQNAAITYTPNSNYFGQDQFTYSVTAVEKNITRSSTVTITINAVNDNLKF